MSNLQESASVKQAENAITFINKEVLEPEAKPMSGMANPMIDQAAGMMAQDLQSFLKGFEQIGLVALAKLANNILTYGNYFPPVPPKGDGSGGSTSSSQPQHSPESGQKAIGDLFNVVSTYGEHIAHLTALLSKMNTDDEHKGAGSEKALQHIASTQNKSGNPDEKNTRRKRIRNPFKRKDKKQR